MNRRIVDQVPSPKAILIHSEQGCTTFLITQSFSGTHCDPFSLVGSPLKLSPQQTSSVLPESLSNWDQGSATGSHGVHESLDGLQMQG